MMSDRSAEANFRVPPREPRRTQAIKRTYRIDLYEVGMEPRPYDDALAEYGVLEVIAPFDPRVAGTPPLGLALRHQRMKTEPTFAAVHGLSGDPYLALLDLGQQSDQFGSPTHAGSRFRKSTASPSGQRCGERKRSGFPRRSQTSAADPRRDGRQ